jgi:hypothetical protein
MRSRPLVGAGLTVALACLAVAPCFGAGPDVAGSNPAMAQAETGGVAVGRASGPEMMVTRDELAALPSTQVTVATEPGHGPAQRSFEGPLLWTVLGHAGAIDPARVRDQVRETVLLVGRDGYTAVLALGEIAPEFEGKQAILAIRMDGQPLDARQLRVVVPGDKRGGRGVHDLVRITVAAPVVTPSNAPR